MNKKGFYITAAIPYVNASPHVGHSLEFVQVDVIARYHRLLGEEVLALTGGDENALKNVQAAEQAGIPLQKFIDTNAGLFLDLLKKLNTKFDVFQKGSDQNHHFPSSQKLWELCAKNGDIYKKEYKGLYCVGCEAFYTKDELDKNGECFEHPGKKLDEVSEINYFFRLSKYQNQLIELITNDTLRIVPSFRKNEVLAFLKKPLLDISISRSNERAKNWGVPVPGDDTQRIYVWFDALNIYQSGIGFGWDEKKYHTWWPADIHVIGKGIVRFHAIYWPVFLLSAGLPIPKTILAHGYLTVNGQKISKTLGNVIDPFQIIQTYGSDALRYYLLKEIPPFDDGDFSYSRMNEIYKADLANELGNLVSRLTNLAGEDHLELPLAAETQQFDEKCSDLLETFQFNLALEYIWKQIKELNKTLDSFAPWKKSSTERNRFLVSSLRKLQSIGFQLQPFVPETAEKILASVSGTIKKVAPLFPKIA